MDRNEFLKAVSSRLTHHFKASKEGYKDSAERHRMEGFMQAGIFMQITTLSEMNKLMEEIHFEVFDKTIEQRKQEQDQQWQEEGIDYSAYEVPTYTRK